MNIFSKLGFSNIEFGDMQIVDEMTMIPVLGNDLSKNISSPEKISFKKVKTYGEMTFENNDDDENNIGIVPSNTMIMSKSLVQDHAMAKCGFVKAGKQKDFFNACCIQQKQHGHMSGNDESNEYDILPLGLRRGLLKEELRNRTNDCGKIWGMITSWLSNIEGVENYQAHLDFFFRPLKNELNDFVAEFEPVKYQIGAVILFGNMLAGIEIMPTVKHWNHYWKWLVRGCYGAELLKLRRMANVEIDAFSLPNIDFDKIEDFLNDIKMSIIKSMVFDIKKGNQINHGVNFKENLINIASGGGDLISENDKPIYLSCVM